MPKNDERMRLVINGILDRLDYEHLCLLAELCDEPVPPSNSWSHQWDALSRIWVKSHAMESIMRNGGIR